MEIPSFLDSILGRAAFAIVCLVVLFAPWVFGAWEMWWFWPLTVCIFLSTLLFSIRLLIRSFSRAAETPEGPPSQKAGVPVLGLLGVLSFIPFLVYAFARFCQADVFVDAERSLLLFLTPFLLGIQVVYGFDSEQRKWLRDLILADLCLLGLYGIINHLGWGSRHVMWLPSFPQYILEARATGPYFCPDHFAGVMELGFALSLGILLARETERRRKIFSGLLAVIALVAVALTKSRGGGLTILAIAAAGMVWGFSQWPPVIRWYSRLSMAAFGAALLIIFCTFATKYMDRFKEHFGWNQAGGKSLAEIRTLTGQKLLESSRGRMIAGALRAWQTSRTFGIGPGMHQNLWPHFAASPDGDREAGVWPTMPNYDFHSYEVHSDWVQLLEEYGVVGLVLFLVPASVVFTILLVGMRRETSRRRRHEWRDTGEGCHPFVLGGILAFVCMAFHSLGDFNLQMPATVWLLAAILAMPVGEILREACIRSS